MNRRDFVTYAAAALATRVAHGQQATKIWRIGFLGDRPADIGAPDLKELRAGLAEHGYVEGKNVVLEVRWSEGTRERRAALAKELAGLKLDVIVTHGVPAALALKRVTTTTPVVVAVAADLLTTGVVSSLSRPGGNITGMTDQVLDLAAKEVELLNEALPRLQLAGLIWEHPHASADLSAQQTQTAAQRYGLRLQLATVAGMEQLEQAMDALAAAKAGAVIVIHSQLTVNNRARIAQVALKKQLAMIGAPSQFTEAGALLSYGPDLHKYFRRAAVFVDKILKGMRPGDIPIEQPTKFELVVNMKTAKALGISIPQSILLRADRVIE